MQFNDVEIRVHGLQRSGNHAIMNWIAAQTAGICIVLNDCKPGTNPFDSMQEYCEYSDGSLVSLLYTWNRVERELVCSRIPRQRNVLIYSYEDRELLGDRVSESWIGSSNSRFEVLIVRDPLNFFASRLQTWDKLTGLKEKALVIELWKKYAREALGFTSVLDPTRTVLVKFGEWKDDAGYRRKVASELGVAFSGPRNWTLCLRSPQGVHLTASITKTAPQKWPSIRDGDILTKTTTTGRYWRIVSCKS